MASREQSEQHPRLQQFLDKFKTIKRIRIELFPAFFNLPIVGLFYYLILSNRANWAIINGAAEGILHLGSLFNIIDFNYVIFLLIILGIMALYCLIYILLGIGRLEWAHNPVLNLIPVINQILMVIIFTIVFTYNARLDYSFLYFFLGIQNGLILYLTLTISILLLFLVLLTQTPPLWKLRILENDECSKKIHPRLTTITTLLGTCLIVPIELLFVIYCPPTKIYWENIIVIMERFFVWTNLLPILWILSAVIFWVAIAFQSKLKRKMTLNAWKALVLGSFAVQVIFLYIYSLLIDLEFGSESIWFNTGFYSNLILNLITYINGIILVMISIASRWKSILSIRRPITQLMMKWGMFALIVFPPYWMFFYQPLTFTAPNADNIPSTYMQNLNGIEFPFQGSTIYPSFEEQSTESHSYINLSGSWKFNRVGNSTLDSLAPRNGAFLPRIATGEQEADYDDSTWQEMHVPQSYRNHYDEKNYGVWWFRKNFTVAQDYADNSLLLKFIAVNYISDIWLDGEYLGSHEGCYYPFAFDVTGKLSIGDHVLVVRSDYPVDLPSFGTRVFATGDSFAFGGIIRDVYVEVAPLATINRIDTQLIQQTMVDTENGSASIDIKVAIRTPATLINRDAELRLTLYPLNFSNENLLKSPETWNAIDWDSPVHTITQSIELIPNSGTNYMGVHLEADIPSLKFWSTKRPNLYAIIGNLSSSSSEFIDDIFCTQVGFRNFSVSGTQLLMNGSPIKLAGITYVEQRESPVGVSLTFEQYYEDFLMLNSTKANYLRAGSLHPQAYLLMDRFGFTAWEESPFNWFNDVNFFMAFSRKIIESYWTEIVFRLSNRAGVIYYGMCNEPWSTIGLFQYLPQVRDWLRLYDPGRIAAFTAASSQDWNPAFNYLSCVTPNTYGGTFEGERYAWDIEIASSITRWGDRNPGKPIIIMEWGYWREWGTDARQVECFNEGMVAFKADSRVQGYVWFSGFDYYTLTYYNGMGIWNVTRGLESPNLLAAMQVAYAEIVEDNT